MYSFWLQIYLLIILSSYHLCDKGPSLIWQSVLDLCVQKNSCIFFRIQPLITNSFTLMLNLPENELWHKLKKNTRVSTREVSYLFGFSKGELPDFYCTCCGVSSANVNFLFKKIYIISAITCITEMSCRPLFFRGPPLKIATLWLEVSSQNIYI